MSMYTCINFYDGFILKMMLNVKCVIAVFWNCTPKWRNSPLFTKYSLIVNWQVGMFFEVVKFQ